MKNEKKIVKRVSPSLGLLAVAFFLFMGPVAVGQEMNREAIDFLNSDTSIVRQYKENTTLIYNRTKHTSLFMRVTEGVTVASSMYMEPLFVNDFEIEHTKAYFCGYTYVDERRKGILGYFDLSSFPNCSVTYYIVDYCVEMMKMDVYSPGAVQEKKIVATGTTTGIRSDALAELTLFATPSFNFYAYISLSENEQIDDVAQTSSNIVVSTRNVEDNISVVNLWQYQNPLTPGMSMFNYVVGKKTIASPAAAGPVYLEYMTYDEYSAVYKYQGYSRIVVLKTDVTNNYYTIEAVDILGLENGVMPKDIKWNKKTDVYDVLTFYHSSINYPMQIYHLPPSVFAGTAPYGTGTKYADAFLWSIDPCQASSPYFVASGSMVSIPKLFRYSHSGRGGCSDRFTYSYDKGNPAYKYRETYIPTVIDDISPREMTPRQVEIPFPKVCGKYNTETSNEYDYEED